ncbi:MFS transporter [Planococcus sp. 107-1]|uniref:MFS transporter n=1 Tax=Planococcus sp. 107-1 TaxID=2908840 RepID=UPI0028831153|nr:MFS transporter [Planococcus sp. 107-1]
MAETRWRNPVILLMSIGIANIGAWIYLIALNLTVLEMAEGSAFAVAALYAIAPAAMLVTNGWSGSVVDRINKKRLMIGLDISRAILIGLLPFIHSLEMIYLFVFLLGILNAIFVPASMVYVSMLLAPEQRKRFNSFRSLVDSGAFLLGPAIAGVLFVISTPEIAIEINAAALLASGLLVMALPNLEGKKARGENAESISWTLLRKDLAMVFAFSKSNPNVARVYLIFSGMMVAATALDSMEAAFSTEILQLEEDEYGFLVSIAERNHRWLHYDSDFYKEARSIISYANWCSGYGWRIFDLCIFIVFLRCCSRFLCVGICPRICQHRLSDFLSRADSCRSVGESIQHLWSCRSDGHYRPDNGIRFGVLFLFHPVGCHYRLFRDSSYCTGSLAVGLSKQ